MVRDDADLTRYAGIGEAISSAIREIVLTGSLGKEDYGAMTFEEFEAANSVVLKSAAKDCFEGAKAHGSWERRLMKLQEAQFYMSELDRREDAAERKESRRIATRDFRMELIVIALIALELIVAGWGIYLSMRESREQAQIMERQIQLLEKMEKAMIRAGNMNLLRQ